VEDKVDLIMWRIGLREVYSLGMIDIKEFMYMYDKNFLYSDDVTSYEAEVVEFITSLIADVENFTSLVNEEMSFIFGGILPDDKVHFKKHWIFHLAECLEVGHIDEEDLDVLLRAVDFNNHEWTEDERYKIFTILDIIRISMLVKIPKSFEFFDNPSFEVLMFANKMDVVE